MAGNVSARFGLNWVTCIGKILKPVKSSACFFREITPGSDICKWPAEHTSHMRLKGKEETTNDSNASLLQSFYTSKVAFDQSQILFEEGFHSRHHLRLFLAVLSCMFFEALISLIWSRCDVSIFACGSQARSGLWIAIRFIYWGFVLSE